MIATLFIGIRFQEAWTYAGGTVTIGTHTGGAAACSEKAQCINCGAKHGAVDSNRLVFF